MWSWHAHFTGDDWGGEDATVDNLAAQTSQLSFRHSSEEPLYQRAHIVSNCQQFSTCLWPCRLILARTTIKNVLPKNTSLFFAFSVLRKAQNETQKQQWLMSEIKGKCCGWGKVCEADQRSTIQHHDYRYRYIMQRMFVKTAILVSEQNQAWVIKSVWGNYFLFEYLKIPTGALKSAPVGIQHKANNLKIIPPPTGKLLKTN